jgi:hypothetical protein
MSREHRLAWAAIIGTLLLAYYDSDGKLVYAGRVGSGINQRNCSSYGEFSNRSPWRKCHCKYRRAPTGKAEPVLACPGESPLRFRRFRSGELEVRGRDETAPLREVPPFGPKIDYRRSLRPRRRETPAQLHQLDPLLAPAKHRGGLGRPDVAAGFKIRSRFREDDRGTDLAERLQIGAVGHVVPEIVAHAQTCRYSSQEPLVGAWYRTSQRPTFIQTTDAAAVVLHST